jgi:transcriptional regulator with XRE-family HTH domain
MKKSISENIRFIREAKNYSQDFVARKLKLTQQAYSQIENKPENATLARLKQLAEILDVSLIELIGEESAFFQQNYNQQGGQAATQMVFHQDSLDVKAIYESYINQLKDEINFLRDIMGKSIPGKNK